MMLNNIVKSFYFIVSVFAFSLASFTAQAKEVNASDPYLLINDVAQEMFSDLATNKDKYREEPELLKGLVEEKLLAYINYKYAAYKVLGPSLKKLKRDDKRVLLPQEKEKLDAFVNAFRGYLITSYASVLTLYNDQKFKVEQPKKVPEKTKRVAVKVKILQSGTEPVNLDFKLLKNKKTHTWSTYDLVAEGVSMITTKQQEWQSTLRKEDGMQQLTQKLNRLASAKVEYKED